MEINAQNWTDAKHAAFLERAGKAEARKIALILLAQQEDSPRGFAAFFELMHGTKLHSEGMKWVKNIYQAHDDEQRGLAQECHRESGKTTVFSKFFFAYRIGKEPHKVNVIIRINDDKANNTTAGIAHIIENDIHWKAVFPQVVPHKEKGWGEKGYYVIDQSQDKETWDRLVTQSPDEPTFVGRGYKSGSIIGSRFNGVVIVDDIHDEDNTRSDRQLAAVHKWYTDTYGFCVMADTWEIWNFTPWTTTDVYAYIKSTGEYLLSKSPLMTPAKEGDPGATYWPPMPLNQDYPELGNIPLSGQWWQLYYPEWWPWERIASQYRKFKALGFARMMFLDLEATKGLNLKKEWLHYYPADQIDPSWPVYIGVDYASTRDKLKQKNRDYASLAIFRAIPGGGLVLVDGWKGRVSKGEAMQKVQSIASVYPTLMLMGVESIGKGEEFYNDLVFLDDIYGKPLPLFEIKSKKSKGHCFEEYLAPRFKMGRIWVSNFSTPWLESFVEQWLTWPNGDNDDDLDAAYMGVIAGEGALPSTAGKSGRTGRSSTKARNPYAVLAGA